MQKLAEKQQTFEYRNGVIVAGLHEHPPGYRWYSVYVPREVTSQFDPLQYVAWRTIPHLLACGAWRLALRGVWRLLRS